MAVLTGTTNMLPGFSSGTITTTVGCMMRRTARERILVLVLTPAIDTTGIIVTMVEMVLALDLTREVTAAIAGLEVRPARLEGPVIL